MRKLLTPALFVLCSTAYAAPFPVVFEAVERAELAAEREGKIVKLPVDTGSTVKQGELLAEIAHKDLRLEKERQEILKNFYGLQLENLSALNKRGVATDVELAEASRDLEATTTDGAITQERIDRSVIAAPFNGIVVKRSAKPYEWVSAGEAVLELVNPESIRAVAFIPAKKAIKMKVGDEHKIQVSDIQEAVMAKVTAIAPAVEEQSNTMMVIWQVTKKPTTLLAGMKGVIQIGVDNSLQGVSSSKPPASNNEDNLHDMSLEEVQKYIKTITD